MVPGKDALRLSLKSDKNKVSRIITNMAELVRKDRGDLFFAALLKQVSCQGHETPVRSLSLKAWGALVAQG